MSQKGDLERNVMRWLARQHRAIDRRQFLTGAAAAGMAASLPLVRARAQTMVLPEVKSIPDKLKGSGKLRVANSGGALAEAERKAVYGPFQKLTGIEILETEGYAIPKIKAQVETKNIEWDTVTLGYGNSLVLLQDGDYLEPIDYSLIDAPGLPDRFRHKYSVSYFTLATVMTYRTDAFKKAPASWADYWDAAQFPGPRNYMSGNQGIGVHLWPALLADGVPMDKLYPMNVPRAFKALDRIKEHIVTYWATGAQSAQLMADNETVLGTAWNGRISPLMARGAPVGISWNGAYFGIDDHIVLKGSPNAANAMKFIAFGCIPEVQARLSLLIDYGYTNTDAEKLLTPDRLKVLPSAHLSEGFFPDNIWERDNQKMVTEAWAKWVLS
jgi:putative spermidine/putrescine transport system substrate-binding protein